MPASSQPPQPPSFLASTPSPVLRFLTSYGPLIEWLRWAYQVLIWEPGKRADAFLVLGGWWGVCVGLQPLLKYGMPLLLFFYLHPISLSISALPFVPKTVAKPKRAASSPQSLSQTLSTLAALPSPSITFSPPYLPLDTSLRIAAIAYPFYLIITWLVPMSILIAITGTVVLTWWAPVSIASRRVLSSSGFLSWIWTKICAYLSGESSLVFRSEGSGTTISARRRSSSRRNKPTIMEDKPDQVPPMRFRFDIYENQRWWMGLDWTSALLPSDPAPYTSGPSSSAPNTTTPAPSPSTLPLPAPSTTVLPHPTNSNLEIRRKAVWTWEDPDWRVLVRRERGAEAERVAVPLPDKGSVPGEKEGQGRVDEAIKRAKGRTPSVEPGADREKVVDESGEEEDDGRAEQLDASHGEEELTDPDGWTYFDNKWQNMDNKGGMGKYTRHRRWTRIALCTEHVEVVPIHPATPTTATSPQSVVFHGDASWSALAPEAPNQALSVRRNSKGSVGQRRTSMESTGSGDAERSGLRARLKNVVNLKSGA